jgi:hypothetical protein
MPRHRRHARDFIARQQELLHDGPDAFYLKQGADALAATPAVLISAASTTAIPTRLRTMPRPVGRPHCLRPKSPVSRPIQAIANGVRRTPASAIWRTAIEMALAKGDLKPAIALYERSGDTLSPGDRPTLSPLIGAAHERDSARGIRRGDRTDGLCARHRRGHRCRA